MPSTYTLNLQLVRTGFTPLSSRQMQETVTAVAKFGKFCSPNPTDMFVLFFPVVIRFLSNNPSGVTPLPALAYTSADSINGIVRTAFQQRYAAFLVIGTAEDFHRFVSVASFVCSRLLLFCLLA